MLSVRPSVEAGRAVRSGFEALEAVGDRLVRLSDIDLELLVTPAAVMIVGAEWLVVGVR